LTAKKTSDEKPGYSDIVLQWDQFKFWREQTQMSCDNLTFRLYPNVSVGEKTILQPKSLVLIQNSLEGVFYFVAVPVSGDELEDNAQNFKGIIFNKKTQEMQFLPFLLLTKSSDLDITFTVDWDVVQTAARSFFANPKYNEGDISDAKEEDCAVAKATSADHSAGTSKLEPEKAKPRGRGVWARNGKPHGKTGTR
jgi:hypothetical protein